MKRRPTGAHSRAGGWVGGAIALFCALVAASPAVAATDYTWAGDGIPSSHGSGAYWSNPANWTNGSAPPNSGAGTLTFPDLTGCNDATESCNNSHNNLTAPGGQPLPVNGLSIADNQNYDFVGNPIMLGAGGLTAYATGTASFSTHISLPIRLGAAQTWSIDAGSGPTTGGVGLGAGLSGGYPLSIYLKNYAPLTLSASDNEVGPVSASGPGVISLSNDAGTGANASLNVTDGQPTTVTNSAVLAADSGAPGTGPLGVTGGYLQVGQGDSPDGTLSVDGGFALSSGELSMYLDHAGTTPGTDYSQLKVSGGVTLGGGFALTDGGGPNTSNDACPALHVGDVDTLITAGGTVSGTFAGIPNGTVVVVNCGGATGTPPDARINYTADGVTATVVSPNAPVTGTLSGPIPTTKTSGKLGLTSSKLYLSGNSVLVPLKCTSPRLCNGRFTITTRAKVGKAKKVGIVTCATTSFTVPANKRGTIKPKLSKACVAIIKSARHQRISGQFTSRPRTLQRGIIESITLIK